MVWTKEYQKWKPLYMASSVPNILFVIQCILRWIQRIFLVCGWMLLDRPEASPPPPKKKKNETSLAPRVTLQSLRYKRNYDRSVKTCPQKRLNFDVWIERISVLFTQIYYRISIYIYLIKSSVRYFGDCSHTCMFVLLHSISAFGACGC